MCFQVSTSNEALPVKIWIIYASLLAHSLPSWTLWPLLTSYFWLKIILIVDVFFILRNYVFQFRFFLLIFIITLIHFHFSFIAESFFDSFYLQIRLSWPWFYLFFSTASLINSTLYKIFYLLSCASFPFLFHNSLYLIIAFYVFVLLDYEPLWDLFHIKFNPTCLWSTYLWLPVLIFSFISHAFLLQYEVIFVHQVCLVFINF